MNAITPAAPPLAYGDLERLADSIAKSGLFGIKTKEQAVVLMMISYAEGRHPVEAARDYDIIQGRPAKKAEAMMRDFIRAGGKVEWHALSDEIADATFTHPQTGIVRIDWNMARATTAGLAGKDNWKKTPRAMLRSRVVSEGIRTLWPLATSGMYVPEEVADMKPANDVEHNGPTIEHTDQREAINTEVPMRAAAAGMPRAPTVRGPAEPPANGKRRTISDWLTAFEIAARDAQTPEEANRVICSDEAVQMKELVTGDAKQRYDAVIHSTLQRWFSEPPDATSDEEAPAIVGEEKLMAG